MDDAPLPGVDLRALERWFDVELPDVRADVLRGRVIAGGKSNLTYAITDGTTTWALRRPPLAHVLPTAHDMAREYRVIGALAPTRVPVPDTLALCPDPGVLGAPFYVMSYVDGVVLDRADAVRQVTPEQAGRSCDLLTDTLIDLHAIDPAAIGLDGFGRPDGFLDRQITRWHTQWEANCTEPRAVVPQLVAALAAARPQPSVAGVVHGDYRLTNVMYAADFTAVAAVVDWEMATVGDPLTDLGLLVVYHTLSTGGDELMPPTFAPARGFRTPADLVARYAAASDRDLSALDWYVAFGYWKLAVIAEGIHHRYLQGKTVGAGFDGFGPAVPRLLDTALTILDRLAG